MTLKILAVLAEAATAKGCLDGALAAARIQPGARIEAFHVKVDPNRLAGAPEEIAIQRLRELEEGTADQRASAVRAIFDRWLGAQSALDVEHIHWREEIGAEAEKVLEEARLADLLVMARPHDMDAHDAMHAILFSTALPLLVPADWSPLTNESLGGHIVIAWKSTPQAKRAVECAAPWLRKASRVTILAIARTAEEARLKEAQDLLDGLGIAGEQLFLLTEKIDLAEQILQIAHQLRANVLVMGAYRHNKLIEWALGGTTRHILSKADMPVFLAH